MTRTRTIARPGLVVVTVAACAGLLTSCSSSGGSKPSTGSSSAGGGGGGGTSVDVKNFSFSPSSLTVAKGATVTWTFDDSAVHNVTASDKSFKSSDLGSGKTYSHQFNTAGTYNYICSIHQYMKGTIVVK